MSRTRINLTPQERSVIERTVHMASEILYHIMSKHSAKERALTLCKPHRQSAKSLASTAAIYNVVDGIQKLPAKRDYIRERFPGQLSKIDKSDSSDILQVMVRLQILKNTQKIVRARGRPRGPGSNDDNLGGKPSYYDKSTVLKGSIESLKNPNILRSINSRLIETSVLPKFLKYRNLVFFFLIRIGDDAFWRTLLPFPFVNEALKDRPKAIEIYLNKIRSLGESELEIEAETLARKTLIRNTNNFTLFIGILAGALDWVPRDG
jgi:hypothetical protein